MLALKREEILARGGIESLWHLSEIISLDVIGIRYDRITASEESDLQQLSHEERHESVWEQLAKTMMQGELPHTYTGRGGFRNEISPELLAETLNSRYIKAKGRTGVTISTDVSRKTFKILGELLSNRSLPDNESSPASSSSSGQRYEDGLLDFFKALDPRLRRQILDGFCEVSDEDSGSLSSVVSYMGPALLQETYATAQDYANAPPLLQGILRKLLPHLSDTFETVTPIDEVKKKLKTLLLEHDQEAYLPDNYYSDLKDVISNLNTGVSDLSGIKPLLSSIETLSVDTRSSELILQLVITDPGGGNPEALIENLTDMCVHFLEMGDYDQEIGRAHV